MYGHQPGCPACAAQRDKESRARVRETQDRNTLSKERASIVTVTVQIKTGSAPAIKVSDTLSVPAGAALDPMSVAITGQRLTFAAIRASHRR
jgi:hypothetical protein